MSIEEITFEAEERMEKSVALLGDQLRGIRTGRANTGLVESIRVEYYGSPTPLKQLANLSTPEPQQILIRPFDTGVIGDIIKAIQTSDLGLTPNSDNKVVRLNVPPSRSSSARSSPAASRTSPRRPASPSATSAATPTSQADAETADKVLTEDDLVPLQGRDPGPHQEVRGQGQRPRREEGSRDH